MKSGTDIKRRDEGREDESSIEKGRDTRDIRMMDERGREKTEILIVEDSPIQAERLRYILERKDFDVIVAEDGGNALDILGGCKPFLVISDIMMPVMNGYELCKQIKSDEHTRDIPVILLTSLTSSEVVLEGLVCGGGQLYHQAL